MSFPHQNMKRVAWTVAMLALTPVMAHAQAVSVATPNAGDVVRDLPASKPALPSLSDTPQAAGPAAETPTVATKFTFNRLVLTGVHSLMAFQIQLLADPYVNKPMGEDELSALLQSLRQRLDRAGMNLAVIGLPAIDTAAGVVTVPVVEPRIGRITVPINADSPVTEDRVRGLLSWFHLGDGQTLDVNALERVMFALNDMPGVQAKARLTPSGDEGVYNVSILTSPRRSWDAAVSADNLGLASVGRVRVGASGRLNNPLGVGDNLDVQTLASNNGGVKVGRLGYELPIGYTPARAAVAVSRLNYKLGDSFAALDAHGDATIVETSVSYPLIRARSRTLLARLGVDDKHFSDHLLDDAPTPAQLDIKRRIRTAIFSLSWESRDTVLGGGYWGAGFTQRFGKLTYADPAQDPSQLGGSFSKRELQLTRLQAIAGPVSAFVGVSSQQASRNLDGAEKVGLGGPRGVRAYAVSEAPSDDAMVVNTELRWFIDRNLTVFALSDWARGHLDHDGTADNNTVTLRGNGLGLSANVPDWATVRATLAWRTTAKGVADPGHDKPRLAVQAQHSF